MNTPKIFIMGFLAVLIVLGIWYGVSRKDESGEMMQKDDAMMTSDNAMETDAMMKDSTTTMSGSEDMMMNDSMMATGSYETYSPEKLAKADTGKVVLFFRATWCPTCKVLDADIHANLKSIPKNVTILDVNYDNSTALKQKYGVTYQHTLVQVDSKGNQIVKWSASPTLADLVSHIK